MIVGVDVTVSAVVATFVSSALMPLANTVELIAGIVAVSDDPL